MPEYANCEGKLNWATVYHPRKVRGEVRNFEGVYRHEIDDGTNVGLLSAEAVAMLFYGTSGRNRFGFSIDTKSPSYPVQNTGIFCGTASLRFRILGCFFTTGCPAAKRFDIYFADDLLLGLEYRPDVHCKGSYSLR